VPVARANPSRGRLYVEAFDVPTSRDCRLEKIILWQCHGSDGPGAILGSDETSAMNLRPTKRVARVMRAFAMRR
jgi:hypothetical protein